MSVDTAGCPWGQTHWWRTSFPCGQVSVALARAMSSYHHGCLSPEASGWTHLLYCSQHPLSQLAPSDRCLCLAMLLRTVFHCLCQGPPTLPQASAYLPSPPCFLWPGRVGNAGVMSSSLPGKGGTKDGIPKDAWPGPHLGPWQISPTPFLSQKCLLSTRHSFVGDTGTSWALCFCSVRFLLLCVLQGCWFCSSPRMESSRPFPLC